MRDNLYAAWILIKVSARIARETAVILFPFVFALGVLAFIAWRWVL